MCCGEAALLALLNARCNRGAMSEPNVDEQPHVRHRIPREILAVILIVALASGATILVLGRTARSGTTTADRLDPASFQQPPTPSGNGRIPGVGEAAPDFTLKTLDGSELTLSTLQGHPVLINFWASWCAPCRAEMPDLVRTYEAHKADGFIVLAINMTFQDSLPDALAFVKEFNMTFPVLLDKTGRVAREQYGLRGLPMSIFVDRNGVIVRRHIGAMTGKQVDTFVAEMLR